ncbi:Zinc finger CCHC-type [Trinorchestia longiramus]|nr:Zinc finger CCHC-type [Trinorchestia longiramus]
MDGNDTANHSNGINKSDHEVPHEGNDKSRNHEKQESESKKHSRSRSRHKSRSRSQSRSKDRKHRRSRSRSHRRSRRSRSKSRSRSHESRSPPSMESARLHVAELEYDTRKSELERIFGKYGTVREIWMARNPPCFAFVVFKRQSAADKAATECDGMRIGNKTVKVTHARPRAKSGSISQGRGFGDMRCYQCGELGHFSRNCTDTKFGYKRPPTPPGYYRRSSSSSRSRSRSPSKRRSSRKHRSRSRSPHGSSSASRRRRSRDRKSKSRERRSKSRGRRSKSRDRRSKSRNRRSKSRDKRSSRRRSRSR